ncbi:MAG: hypothetical protein KAW87_01280 [Candidatus Cloacimonetes bacterium]|nr:hypothetical protein [Candidatus Cloacimonadota bacterium]
MGKKEHEILITLRKGMIENISGIPDGIKIVIHDFDVDGCSKDSLTTTPGGEKVIISSWDFEDNEQGRIYCDGCGEFLPLSEFNNRSAKIKKLKMYCKECQQHKKG